MKYTEDIAFQEQKIQKLSQAPLLLLFSVTAVLDSLWFTTTQIYTPQTWTSTIEATVLWCDTRYLSNLSPTIYCGPTWSKWHVLVGNTMMNNWILGYLVLDKSRSKQKLKPLNFAKPGQFGHQIDLHCSRVGSWKTALNIYQPQLNIIKQPMEEQRYMGQILPETIFPIWGHNWLKLRLNKLGVSF